MITFQKARENGLTVVAVDPQTKAALGKEWQLHPRLSEYPEDQARRVWQVATRTGVAGIVTRQSCLLGIETDTSAFTSEVLDYIEQHGLWPLRVERREKNGESKRHIWLRLLAGALEDPDTITSLRFDLVTVKSSGSKHPEVFCARTGMIRTQISAACDYRVATENSDAPALSDEQYAALVAYARARELELGHPSRGGRAPGGGAGNGDGGSGRSFACYSFACLLTRWSSDEDLVCRLAALRSAAVDEPPLTEREVQKQVHGAFVTARAKGTLRTEIDLFDGYTIPAWEQAEAIRNLLRQLVTEPATSNLNRQEAWAAPELAGEIAAEFVTAGGLS